MVGYGEDRRPLSQSGRSGPGSPRDREVALEIEMGSLGCGDLIYELREQLTRASAGQIVRIVSDDPGAFSEIPAWCRMSGHALLEADPPFYVIQAGGKP